MSEIVAAPANQDPTALMNEARDFFATEYGLNFDENNQLVGQPEDNQLEALAGWRQSTFENGLEMADRETFARKVFLAQALMPQRDAAGNITYLFGKGIGAEIALQGEVAGRTKRQADVPYRTHSDFEIYAINEEDPPAGFNAFRKVFGSQETYPVHKTKGLSELPPTFLHDSAEEVNLGGVSVLVPKLEVQFVDKLEKGNERVETRLRNYSDAELLAQTYELDSQEVHGLLDAYVIEPAARNTDTTRQLGRLRKNALMMGPDSLANATIGVGKGDTLRLSDFDLGPELLDMDEADAIAALDDAVQQTFASKHVAADLALQPAA